MIITLQKCSIQSLVSTPVMLVMYSSCDQLCSCSFS